MKEIKASQIMEILPHKYPFLMIDKAEILEEAESVVAYKNVTINEQYFQGHFPIEPIVPGVLIIESLAQSGAVLILAIPENQGKLAYFGGIRNARFRSKVVPGDILRLEFIVTEKNNNIVTGMGIAYVEEKIVCEAEIYFVVQK